MADLLDDPILKAAATVEDIGSKSPFLSVGMYVLASYNSARLFVSIGR